MVRCSPQRATNHDYYLFILSFAASKRKDGKKKTPPLWAFVVLSNDNVSFIYQHYRRMKFGVSD